MWKHIDDRDSLKVDMPYYIRVIVTTDPPEFFGPIRTIEIPVETKYKGTPHLEQGITLDKSPRVNKAV